jgi:hypothetical protein
LLEKEFEEEAGAYVPIPFLRKTLSAKRIALFFRDALFLC